MEEKEMDNTMMKGKMSSFRNMKEKEDYQKRWREMISMGFMNKERDNREGQMIINLMNSKMSNQMKNKIITKRSINNILRCKLNSMRMIN